MRPNQRLLLYVAICCTMIGIVAAILSVHDASDKPTVMPAATFEAPTPQPKRYQKTAALAAVGDVLIHDRVYQKAKTKDRYNFKPMLKAVKPYIQHADLAVANSESIVGGSDIGLSSYPSFNSPYELGDALKDAGFDVVTMANNHTLDRGVPAIKHAIHHWDKIGMVHTGSFLSKKDRNNIRTVTRNDITFSFLAYTYGTNGIRTPKGKEYLVNRMNLPRMKKEIKKAKQKSDVVVVALHFGEEYERKPNKKQKHIVQQLADAGVDIILGSHPHVLQPVKWVEGNGDHQTFVVYSLGNFFTGQDDSLYKELGGILKLKVDKTVIKNKTKIEVKQPRFVFTWLNPKNYHVVPLTNDHHTDLKNESTVYRKISKHMRQKMPALKILDKSHE